MGVMWRGATKKIFEICCSDSAISQLMQELSTVLADDQVSSGWTHPIISHRFVRIQRVGGPEGKCGRQKTLPWRRLSPTANLWPFPA